jgi:hypothetical protein
MKTNLILFLIYTIGVLLIFIGCDSKSTDPEESNYQISSWIAYTNWTQASPPTSSDSVLYYYSQIGKIAWYNPYDQVLIADIWPSRDVNAKTGRTTDVLAIKFEPNSATSYSWDGIMRTFPEDDDFPVESGYFEIWIFNSDTGNIGTVHIDLGRISEDWWLLDSNHLAQPSLGYLNTEDINFNGIYDDGEDTGVDGTPFSEQPSSWPDDRWQQPDRNTNSYFGINGTESNSAIKGPHPDTEDINLNGILDLHNDYFEYKFSLDKNSPDAAYIDSINTNGWTKYKIPLNSPHKSIGNPSWLDLEFFRLWIDGVNVESLTIYIAQIKFTE